MRASWLNIFFRFSGKVFQLKQNLINSTRWYVALYYALLLLFTELILTVISFPLYFLVAPKNIQKGGQYSFSGPKTYVQEYVWRRKIAITTSFGAVAVLLIKIVLVGGLSFYLLGAQKLLAETQNWTFGIPTDYLYNSSTIEIVGEVAQLKDTITTTSSSTINSGFDTAVTGWTYLDWLDGGKVSGARVTSGGNPGPYVNVVMSDAQNKIMAGIWYQSFVTNVSSPDSATVNLGWSSILWTNGAPPRDNRILVFITTSTALPTLGTEVWSSGQITGTTTWASTGPIDIRSKIPTAGRYYIMVAGYFADAVSPNATYRNTVGFDNIIVNWSKTTHTFATSSPTTTPFNSLSVPAVSSWNGFTETATKNGGEIYYQLSGDNGSTWKYWNGTVWATAGATNSSTAAVVNAYISSFPTSTKQIKWRSFFKSDGSQQVKLSGISITYTQNDPPQITDIAAAQSSSTGNVYINYNLKDANSDPQSLVNFEYSLTGAFAGEQVTMAASTTDPVHSGTSGLSSSPAGTAHTFAWDARSQLGNIATSTVFVRLRANDGIANSGFATSAVFAVDYVAPTVTNVSAVQTSGSTTVNISYDLSDNSTSSLTASLEISNDGGSTWDVPSISAVGNVGSGQTPGTGKTIVWDAGVDFSGHDLTVMRVRLRARDAWQNQGSFSSSTNFSLDTLAPAVATIADLQAQPHAGDSAALIGGSFTETNPNTNNFYVALDGGDYGSATAGDPNTAVPAAQNTVVGLTLKGSNYISKVKIVHTDDFGQATSNENNSPIGSFKYVKPYTPPAPVVDNPGENQVDVTISKNTDEASGLEYAIFETSQSKYVQADGTLGAVAVWQQIGSGAGQWGNGAGADGKITVTGLSSPIAQYSFAVKSRNSADLAHAVTSESDLSPAAGISNTAASLSITDVSQQAGNSYALIHYIGSDAQSDVNNLVTFEYSTDGTNWFPMTEKSGVGSSGTGPLSFTSAGANFIFAWDINANLPNFESSVVRIRLKSNDGLLDSNLAESSVFVVDTKAPTVTITAASQAAGSSLVNFTYDLADNSVASNTVQVEISDDGGATWAVPVTNVFGDVGSDVSAGVSRSMTWNAYSDYPNSENNNFKVKIKATDRFGNASSFVESDPFTVDTKGPVVSSVTASVNSENKVVVSYDLSDITAAGNAVEFAVSSDDGLTWDVVTSTYSGEVGSGQITGSRTFTWNAPVDFAGQASTQMKVRVRATDAFGNIGSFADSSSFTLDAAAPVISNLTAAQTVNSTSVKINYDLSDTEPNVSVSAQISADGGSTWSVATSTLVGDVGATVGAGSGKVITWQAGTDFGGQESNTVRVRLQATDGHGNASAFFVSADFSVDTLAPVALTNFRKSASTASSVTLAWDSGVTDAHFDHYELWYGSSETEVNNHSGAAARWSTAQDSSLSDKLTAATTISGVSITTDFFVKLFAVDQFGNESSLPAINVYSPTPITPTTTPTPSVPAVSGGVAIPVPVADIIPPAAPLVFSPSPDSVTGEPTPTIIGGTEPGAVINIILDGVNKFIAAADANGTWQFILPSQFALQNGRHTFALTSVDQAGNESSVTLFNITKAIIPGAPPAVAPTIGGAVGIPPIITPGIVLQPTPPAILVQQGVALPEAASLPAPTISVAPHAVAGDSFVFSGTALPNHDVLVYVHSSQALIYRTHSDNNGNWQVTHSQQVAELTPGDHTVFAVSVDTANQVKSRPSPIQTFTVKKNFWVSILTLLNLETTALALVALGLTMIWLYRLKTVAVEEV